MSSEPLTFDPEGDLLLRFRHPDDDREFARNDERLDSASTVDGDTILTPATTNSDDSLSAYVRDAARMLVSSRHLILASPIFKAKIRRARSRAALPQEVTELNLPDDDLAGFEILLNIIHGHVRKVPEEVDVGMLTNLSILVEKYQVSEIMQPYIQIWIPKLRESLPTTFTSELLHWLSISWVFKLRDEFKKITCIAQQESSSKLRNTRERPLPIPQLIIDRIEASRQRSISSILTSIKTLIDKFTVEIGVCSTNLSTTPDGNFSCSALMLGSLMKSLSTHGLWPLPRAPYDGLSILKVTQQARELKIYAICDQSRFFTFPTPRSPGHGWVQWLQDQVNMVVQTASGLDLLIMTYAGSSFGTLVTGL